MPEFLLGYLSVQWPVAIFETVCSFSGCVAVFVVVCLWLLWLLSKVIVHSFVLWLEIANSVNPKGGHVLSVSTRYMRPDTVSVCVCVCVCVCLSVSVSTRYMRLETGHHTLHQNCSSIQEILITTSCQT